MKLFAVMVTLLAAAGGAPVELLDPIARLGAVGVLGVIAIWLAVKTIPAMTAEFRKTVAAIAAQQHDDSTKLNETLAELRENCAATRRVLTP